MSDTQTKKKERKNPLRKLVDKQVAVLDEKRDDPELTLASTIENPKVRDALRRNRKYGDLHVDLIQPDPQQVRHVDTTSEAFDELVSSIKEHGVIEPITVRWLKEKQLFQVITGERRLRASQALKLETIPAIVRDVTDTKKVVHQLVENLQREDMNPIEEAKAFKRYLAATGQKKRELAKAIGKSKAYVSQIMSLLEHLSVDEQATLAKVSPAKLPGKTLILEALRTDDKAIRAAILSGQLTRLEARSKIEKTKAKPSAVRTYAYYESFRLENPNATVSVRFRKTEASAEEVLAALEAAIKEQRDRMKSGSD